MDVSTMGGKSFQSGYYHILDKTDLASDVKRDHRGIYQKVAHPRRVTILNLARWFVLFLGLAVVTKAQAEEHYIYQDPDGKLVISNKQPPPGSKIIKQQNFPDVIDSEVPRDNPQPNGQIKASPKPSNSK